jgi:hypothetical protein
MALRRAGHGSFERCRAAGGWRHWRIAIEWHCTGETAMNPSYWAARHDPYRNIHKGLRAAMFDTLQRVGRMDPADAAEFGAALDQVDSLLAVMAAHVKHEDEFLHAAIAARRPNIVLRTADDHGHHLEALAVLRGEVSALRAASVAVKSALAHRLYLDLADFVAENLQHMRVEETENNETLCALYSDEEVIAVHDRLLASVEPAVMMECIGWMARGLSVPELGELLAEIGRKAPPPAFEAALAQVRRQLDSSRWRRVAQALELPSGETATA